jgi:hypothetical protein
MSILLVILVLFQLWPDTTEQYVAFAPCEEFDLEIHGAYQDELFIQVMYNGQVVEEVSTEVWQYAAPYRRVVHFDGQGEIDSLFVSSSGTIHYLEGRCRTEAPDPPPPLPTPTPTPTPSAPQYIIRLPIMMSGGQ